MPRSSLLYGLRTHFLAIPTARWSRGGICGVALDAEGVVFSLEVSEMEYLSTQGVGK